MRTIILTQRVDFKDEIQEMRDVIDHRLVQWVVASGYMPLTISNALIRCDQYNNGSNETILEKWLNTVQPRALMLTGGNDIGEYPARDETEKYLLSWAKTYRLPVLGICRGMQLMGVWAGMALAKVDGHGKTRHYLKGYDKTHDWPDSVNSYHNWGLASCPDGFRVMARSEEGAIEAIRHIKLPWEGWMWHPERETQFSPQDIKRLKALFGD